MPIQNKDTLAASVATPPVGSTTLFTDGSQLKIKTDAGVIVPIGSGSGSVTSVSVTTANGVSGTVSNPTTTPAISLTLDAITPTSVSIAGNLTFTGNSRKIFGDFSNATASNRPYFQTSTANSNTFVGAMPSGTALIAAFVAEAGSDPANNSTLVLQSTSTGNKIESSKRGTGTVHALSIGVTTAADGIVISTTNNVSTGGTGALSTTATDKFLYLGSCAGLPTGVPTSITGKTPLVVDSTNNKFYFYSGGAWQTPGGSPAGSTTQIQFNNAGAFAGSANFTFTTAGNILTIGDAAATGTIRGKIGAIGSGLEVVAGEGTAGAGGGLTLLGGSGTTVNGQVTIEGGESATAAGAAVTLKGGTGIGFNGGNASVLGGGGNAGGALNIQGGAGASDAGGWIEITGGAGQDGGYVFVTGGAGNSLNANGGDARLIGGAGAGAGGGGGWVTIDGGQASGVGEVAGRVSIRGGVNFSDATQNGEIWFDTSGINRFRIARTGDWLLSGSAGTSGHVLTSNGTGTAPTWQAAAGPSEPTNQIVYGTGSGTDSSADFLWNPSTNVMTVGSDATPATITTPNSAISVAGITVNPGVGTGVGGANLDLAGGTGFNGGFLNLDAGAANGSGGAGGTARLRGGTPVNGNGGQVELTAADGVGTNRSGGNVTITAGSRTGSGTAGVINLVIPATGALQVNSAAGTSGQALTSNGATTAPTWQTIVASTATNLSGGATNQIPYQSAASTTAFSSKFTWTNSADTLTVGPTNGLSSATITTPVGGSGEDGTSLTVRAGNSTDAITVAGDLYLRGGDGSATVNGGTVTIAGGGGAGLTGGVIIATGATARLQISSSQIVSSILMGYGTGAGGTVTQATSRTTGVTLNKPSGAITLFSDAGSTTPATFTVTNNQVVATDVIILNQKSGTDLYHLLVTNVAAGSFKITAFTTGGTTTEQPVINFAVLKGSIT
jgi:hypothetical protein